MATDRTMSLSDARSMGRSLAVYPSLWRGQAFAHVGGLLRSGTGQRMYDISGNRNDGTLVNGPTWVPGAPGGGYALEFDGSNDYVEVPHATELNVSLPLSISIWLKYTSDANQVIFEKNGNNGFSLQQAGTGSGLLSLWAGGSGNGVRTAAGYNDGLWHFFVFVLSSTTVGDGHVYVDGVEVAIDEPSDAGTPSYGTNTPIYIGSRAGSFGQDGQYANISLYARTLHLSDAIRFYFDPLALVRQRAQVVAIQGAAPAVGHAGPLVNGPMVKSKFLNA